MHKPFPSPEITHSENTPSRAFHTSIQAKALLPQMTPQWWEELRQMLEQETGMDLSGSRGSRLREAVNNVVRRNRSLESVQSNHAEHARFVESVAAELTIGESYFLRNENHMKVLREAVFPRILSDNRDRKEVRAWSAGCATGEEPYSLAILLDEMLGPCATWHVSVLGTDLNPNFLEKGRQGWYRQWSFRQTNIQKDPRFFAPDKDGYRIHDHLRQQVRFNYLNLVKDIYPSGLNGTLGLDLILFRNVAIYLKADVTHAILHRLFRSLRPGGWLLLGEIEVTLAPVHGFEIHRFPHATFYRKPLDAGIEFGFDDDARPATRPAIPPAVVRQFTPAPVPFLAGLPLPAVPVLPDWVPLPAAVAAKVPAHQLLPQPEMTPQVIPKSEERLRQVNRLLQQAQTTEARAELKMCIKENPLCIEAYLLQAGLAEDLGHLQEAEQSYRRALYLDRDCTLAHFHLGLVLQQQGESDQAYRSLRTARLLTDQHDPRELVEHGDGVCYGRLKEMVMMLTGESDE